jgi:DNA-binding MarR family transcriptional regulator
MFYLRDLPNYETIKKRAARYAGADPAAIESCLVLLRVAVDVLAAFDAYLARHKMSAGRFSLLMILNRDPDNPMSPSDLAARAGVTRATVTGLLDGLEREQLVERRHGCDDRRTVLVRLTPAAHHRLEEILPDYHRRVANLMGELSEAEKKTLTGLLGKVKAGIPTITAV